MKYVRRVSFALLTFLVGIAVAPIQFYYEASGRGKVVDGGWAGITCYRSSYFVKLCVAHEGYGSPETANEVFDEHLSKAVKVIELGPKVNAEGAVVGRRATAVFFAPEIPSYYTETLWTDGSHLHYIFSTSALHVREFEKHQR